MRENRSYGSVRGAARKSGPYRDHQPVQTVNNFAKCLPGYNLRGASSRTTVAHTQDRCPLAWRTLAYELHPSGQQDRREQGSQGRVSKDTRTCFERMPSLHSVVPGTPYGRAKVILGPSPSI